MINLNGDYCTKVFEGPYPQAPKWGETFEAELEQGGFDVDEVYFFYTTCPKCAKSYGKNYVVAVANGRTRNVPIEQCGDVPPATDSVKH